MPKKILVLTPRLPYPLIGGDKIRIYNICKGLYEEGFQLTLLSFVENHQEEIFAQKYADNFIFSRIATVALPKWKSYVNSFFGLFGKNPLQANYYWSEKMKFLIDKELNLKEYDAVLVHLIRMAPYVIDRQNIKRILEMTDAISLMYERSKIYKNRGLFGKIYGIEENRVKKYEQKCIDKFDFSVLVSGIDRDYLLENSNHKTTDNLKVISHGVSEKIIEFSSVDYDKNLIIFLGNMRTHQNNDAVLYFIRKIWPLIRLKNPLMKFRIIGNAPTKKVMYFNNIDGIEITGRVDEILPYIKNACASVCPLRIGAGMQTKILESMGMGIPVITTSIGAEGIEGISEKHFLVFDNPADFAEAVLKLTNNGNIRQKISFEGKELIREKYLYPKIIKDFYVKLFD